MRRWKQYREIRRALHLANRRGQIRVIHFSIQGNHFHLIVEADSKPALARGMHGLNISVGKRLNKVAGKRRGPVFADRYHSRLIDSPRQTRNTLCYVLQNARRHAERRTTDPNWVDPFSSASFFDGWKHNATTRSPDDDEQLVRSPRSWLLRTGWRKHGLISVREVPG